MPTLSKRTRSARPRPAFDRCRELYKKCDQRLAAAGLLSQVGDDWRRLFGVICEIEHRYRPLKPTKTGGAR